jgi:hypothetical protein
MSLVAPTSRGTAKGRGEVTKVDESAVLVVVAAAAVVMGAHWTASAG